MHRPQRDAQAEREMIKRENKLFDVEINKAEFVKNKKTAWKEWERKREKEKGNIIHKHYTAHARVYAYTSVCVWRTLSENKRNDECQRLFLSSKA